MSSFLEKTLANRPTARKTSTPKTPPRSAFVSLETHSAEYGEIVTRADLKNNTSASALLPPPDGVESRESSPRLTS